MPSNDDVICVIRARGGSKGLPRKNVRLFAGEPLIARPIRQAIASGVIGTVLVTTDDEEIASAARTAGAVVPFLRPPELAQDLTTTEAVETSRSRPELESVFSGHKTHENFWERQEDRTWLRVRPWMAVYLACASRARLWREGRRIGDRVEIIVNDDAFTGIDVHEDEDLQLAEVALRIRGGERVRD